MRLYKCDMCGEEIKNKEPMATVEFHDSEPFDLCHKCHYAIIKTICASEGILSPSLNDYCCQFVGNELEPHEPPAKQMTIFDELGS